MNQSSPNQNLHELIEVDATFSRKLLGHCRPVAFRTSSGREVLITQVGLVHPKYDGLRTTFAFDVTDGATDYRLALDCDSLNWYLEFEGDSYV